jgi:hypothetical protein
MKKLIIPVIALSLITFTSHADDKKSIEQEDTCTVLPPIIKTVYVDKIVYVDKVVPGPTVYVTKNVPGPVVYVDKVVTETNTVTNTVYVDKPIVQDHTITVENPLNISLQNQLNALKNKYNKLLKSYKINRNHELKEASKKKAK